MATLRIKTSQSCSGQFKERYFNDIDPAMLAGSGSVAGFVSVLSQQLVEMGRCRMAEIYRSTLKSFMRFRGNRGDLAFCELDSHMAQEYEAYLRREGLCPNSSSFYMRNLRSIYNKAVDEGMAPQGNPFRRVYTGVDKTVKRAVSADVIRLIRDIDLRLHPALDLARDLFMFSFYTRGMSFVDMAYLRKSDLRNGILSYRRRKTNRQLFVKWERQMQAIVDKYSTGDSPYLLPIIKNVDTDLRRQYQNASHFVNTKLREIGVMLGLSMPLTAYVARHGWASIAKSKQVPVATISEAMGHDSETTTRIYLASLDTAHVDRANHLVLSAI